MDMYSILLEGSTGGQFWHRASCSGLTTLSTEVPVCKINIQSVVVLVCIGS